MMVVNIACNAFCMLGVLAVRTVLSIMPTLSREYDLHFKSFSNVPLKMKEKKPTTANGSKAASNSSTATNQSSVNGLATSKRATSAGRTENGCGMGLPSGVVEKVLSAKANDNAENENTETDLDNQDSVDAQESNEDGNNSGDANSDDEEFEAANIHGHPIRGSRCFEVLGIDVMVDSKLRPTLIEFNHLPRCAPCLPISE